MVRTKKRLLKKGQCQKWLPQNGHTKKSHTPSWSYQKLTTY